MLLRMPFTAKKSGTAAAATAAKQQASYPIAPVAAAPAVATSSSNSAGRFAFDTPSPDDVARAAGPQCKLQGTQSATECCGLSVVLHHCWSRTVLPKSAVRASALQKHMHWLTPSCFACSQACGWCVFGALKNTYLQSAAKSSARGATAATTAAAATECCDHQQRCCCPCSSNGCTQPGPQQQQQQQRQSRGRGRFAWRQCCCTACQAAEAQ